MKAIWIIISFTLLPSIWAEELILNPDQLNSYMPSMQAPTTWPGSACDPLRIDFSKQKDKHALSSEDQSHINAIKTAIDQHGIEGIIFGRGSMESKLLIGGHVFSTGDELQFVSPNGDWEPIHSGRSVILLEIAQDKGTFLVSGHEFDAISPESGIQFEISWEDFFKFS